MRKEQRRKFLTASSAMLGALLLPKTRAQGRLPVLGVLNPQRRPPPESFAKNPFLSRLRDLGWIEGKTLHFERAYAEGKLDRLPELAAMLAAKNVDVIWAGGPVSAVAAARATTTIPIVFWSVGYPVEVGLVDSLARPGRNVTGLAWLADERIVLKRPQLLRELAPNARRHAILTVISNDPTVAGGMLDLKPMRDRVDAVFRDQGFESRRFVISAAADLEPALAAMAKWGPHSLGVPDVGLTNSNRKQIVDFARRYRLIDIYETIEWIRAGGLFSYGIALLPTLLRTADMVDSILRGAKPATMPVELPSHFELVVNLATAKALGLKVPQSILIRADHVIE